MEKSGQITHLFVDIGGVILTNGWDRNSRRLAAEHFKLDYEEFEGRHQLNFGVMEEGKLTLNDYLNRVVFFKERPFSVADFKTFIFSQSKRISGLQGHLLALKQKYALRICAVSNESREINAHRIQTFHLDSLIDTFVSSCYVGTRKPDIDMYRIALDLSQAKKDEVIYIENTSLFVEIAENFGINSVLHESFETTCEKLADYGLSI